MIKLLNLVAGVTMATTIVNSFIRQSNNTGIEIDTYDCSAVTITESEFNELFNSNDYCKNAVKSDAGGYKHSIYYSNNGTSNFYYDTNVSFEHIKGDDSISVKLSETNARGLTIAYSGGVSCEVIGSGASVAYTLTKSSGNALTFTGGDSIFLNDESGKYRLYIIDERIDAIMVSEKTVEGNTKKIYTKLKYLPYSSTIALELKKSNSPYIPYCG